MCAGRSSPLSLNSGWDARIPDAGPSLTDFRFNPHFPVNTLTLMRGAVATAKDNALEPYIEAGLAAMWEQGLFKEWGPPLIEPPRTQRNRRAGPHHSYRSVGQRRARH